MDTTLSNNGGENYFTGRSEATKVATDSNRLKLFRWLCLTFSPVSTVAIASNRPIAINLTEWQQMIRKLSSVLLYCICQ